MRSASSSFLMTQPDKSNLTDSEHNPARAVSSPAGLGDSISNSAPSILIRALTSPLQAAPIRSVMSSRTLEESLHRRRDALEEARRRQSRVSFAHVNIREYERVLGDNPSVTSGPPLSIGWRHSPTLLTVSLDDYESGKGFPRSSSEYLVPKSVRETMLKEHAGVSRREIVNAVRIIQKEKAGRRKTVVNLGMAPAEERIEEVKRKMKTILKPSSSYSCLEAKLWDDAHARAMEKAQTLEESIRRGERVSPGDIWRVGTPYDSILPSRNNTPSAVTRKSPLAFSPPSSSSSSEAMAGGTGAPSRTDERSDSDSGVKGTTTTDERKNAAWTTKTAARDDRRLSSSIVAEEPSDSDSTEIFLRLLMDDSSAN